VDRKDSEVLRLDHRLRGNRLRWKGVKMKSEDIAKTSHYTGPINVMTCAKCHPICTCIHPRSTGS
jgi:hypothetical protein